MMQGINNENPLVLRNIRWGYALGAASALGCLIVTVYEVKTDRTEMANQVAQGVLKAAIFVVCGYAWKNSKQYVAQFHSLINSNILYLTEIKKKANHAITKAEIVIEGEIEAPNKKNVRNPSNENVLPHHSLANIAIKCLPKEVAYIVNNIPVNLDRLIENRYSIIQKALNKAYTKSDLSA